MKSLIGTKIKAMATLQSRLRDYCYVNFLKTGLCLADLKDGLEELADCQSQELQDEVLSSLQQKNNPSRDGLCAGNPVITKKGRSWLIECNGNFCRNCTGFIGEVHNYCSPPFRCDDIYWKNTNCSLWPCKGGHWQLARLFILNKNPKVSPMSAAETDLSGILYFFENCSLASKCVTDKNNIQKVREVRNAYMHIPKMQMSEGEFMTQSGLLLDLLNDVNSNKTLMDLDVAIWKINKVRTTKFSIKPIHEFMVMSDMLNDVGKQNSRLLQHVDRLKIECERLEKNQRALNLELEEETEQLQSDANTITDTFNNLKVLVQRSDDMIASLSRQVGEIDKSLKQVNRDIRLINRRIHRQLVINGTVLAVTGGVAGGVVGALGGPLGAAAGATLGYRIGRGIGRLFGNDD